MVLHLLTKSSRWRSIPVYNLSDSMTCIRYYAVRKLKHTMLRNKKQKSKPHCSHIIIVVVVVHFQQIIGVDITPTMGEEDICPLTAKFVAKRSLCLQLLAKNKSPVSTSTKKYLTDASSHNNSN